MCTIRDLINILGAALLSASALSAHAADGRFYDPRNAASPTGYTIGYELFRTIGCPGRGLLDVPCPVEETTGSPALIVADTPTPKMTDSDYLVGSTTGPVDILRRLVLKGVNFDFDRATLRREDMEIIDKNVLILKDQGKVKIEISGHTDHVGSDRYNMGLSLRRAAAVRDYLISKGIPAGRLIIQGYGESQPVASNDTDAGRAQNRRVELNQASE